ncbi:hypothetical protein EVG20_g4244 [Dentipellis fragilis]|uniref:Uncharacterized protein n=1 Tax=Dentipellis fragilis TaxID=205917 RepID=A0A4Y9YYU1_9AGAM|nr:hypothetical protein EVG20_g4244 [Dentipellis fragilis]
MSLLDHFSPLDELIQLIYQGSSRFVLLSHVDLSRDEPAWRVRMGLAREGLWWQGRWTEGDVLEKTGNKATPEVLEAFAERLAETVIKGDLQIEDYRPNDAASNQAIKLTIGQSVKKPLHMPLKKMEPKDAAKFAADQFSAVSLLGAILPDGTNSIALPPADSPPSPKPPVSTQSLPICTHYVCVSSAKYEIRLP